MKTFFSYFVCLLSLAGVACLAYHAFVNSTNELLVIGIALTGVAAFGYPLVMWGSNIILAIQGLLKVKPENQIDL